MALVTCPGTQTDKLFGQNDLSRLLHFDRLCELGKL
jgi:hypothetical protein